MNAEPTPKQRRRLDRILQYSYEVVLNEGFYKLSIRDLTESLHVSRSTIYEIFGSKEGLISKIVEMYDEQLDFGLMEIMDDKELTTYDRFLAISDQLASNSPNPSIYKFHRDLKIHLPDLYDKYLQGRDRRIQKVYQPLISEGIENGLFDKKIPHDFLLESYLKSSQMVCETNMLERTNIGKKEAMNLMTRIFLNGSKSI